jgi:hypothetical protein
VLDDYELPVVAFSEAMRDIDLFAIVALAWDDRIRDPSIRAQVEAPGS